MYTLYKITNQINDKTYIGITKLGVVTRFSNHQKQISNPKYPLHKAFIKYGVDNFIIQALCVSDNRRYISNLEQPAIELYESHVSQNGYNVAQGGFGGNLGDIVNKKISEASLNMNPDVRFNKSLAQSKMMKGNTLNKGNKHSDENKKLFSKLHKGKLKSDLTRQRMSESAIINDNGKRFKGRNACCLCCKREWDIGNYTQHIRKKNEL